ncbi:MAG: F0F1 ATP synthase subunit A [Lachnospiraceae bacterium]|nr:F0F1 ATP synthase subunit A [Lachnospiraceae bacterium]
MGMLMTNMMAGAGSGVMLADADFTAHYLMPINLFGQKVFFTTTHVCTCIVLIAILALAFYARHAVLKEDYEVPNNVQNVVEMLIEFLDGVVANNMGRHAKAFSNYIMTLMIFIFIANTSGLFGLRPPTADYGTTLALALISFVLIQYSAFKTSGLRALSDLAKPIPILLPINIIGEISTPLSMSLRLFGNVVSGTVMMGLWYGLLPVFVKLGLPAFLHVYFDLFSGAIQTYVFAMLTMVYITDKRDA